MQRIQAQFCLKYMYIQLYAHKKKARRMCTRCSQWLSLGGGIIKVSFIFIFFFVSSLFPQFSTGITFIIRMEDFRRFQRFLEHPGVPACSLIHPPSLHRQQGLGWPVAGPLDTDQLAEAGLGPSFLNRKKLPVSGQYKQILCQNILNIVLFKLVFVWDSEHLKRKGLISTSTDGIFL